MSESRWRKRAMIGADTIARGLIRDGVEVF
jgi:hypothetical protein